VRLPTLFVPEAKLAEPASKRPLALTIIAAGATLVVVGGVFTGPSVLGCLGTSADFGVCVRDSMAQSGLLPEAPVQPTEIAAIASRGVAPAPTAPEASATADKLVGSTSGPAPANSGPAPANSGPAPANSGLAPANSEQTPAGDRDVKYGLRAEPDGSIVIAGSGRPGQELEIFSNGELLGTTTVEPSGDWVFVPDSRLSPGGIELTVGEKGSPTRVAQSFVVVIDPDLKGEPLVVASVPGQASDILQGLARPTPQVAQLEVGAVPAQTPQNQAPESQAASNANALASDTSDAAGAAARQRNSLAGEAPGAGESAPGAGTEGTSAAGGEAGEANSPEQSAAIAPSDPQEPAISAGSTPSPDADAPADGPARVDDPQGGAGNDTELAAVDREDVASPVPDGTDAPAVPAVQPTIDAIEIDNNRNFFAGSGPDGATVRLYIDDQFIADAVISGERWLVESGNVLTKPAQRIRIDLLAPGSAAVSARAEVNFLVDAPATNSVAPPTAIAGNEPQGNAQAPIVLAQNDRQPSGGAGSPEPLAATPDGESQAAAREQVTPPPTETASSPVGKNPASTSPSAAQGGLPDVDGVGTQDGRAPAAAQSGTENSAAPAPASGVSRPTDGAAGLTASNSEQPPETEQPGTPAGETQRSQPNVDAVPTSPTGNTSAPPSLASGGASEPTEPSAPAPDRSAAPRTNPASGIAAADARDPAEQSAAAQSPQGNGQAGSPDEAPATSAQGSSSRDTVFTGTQDNTEAGTNPTGARADRRVAVPARPLEVPVAQPDAAVPTRVTDARVAQTDTANVAARGSDTPLVQTDAAVSTSEPNAPVVQTNTAVADLDPAPSMAVSDPELRIAHSQSPVVEPQLSVAVQQPAAAEQVPLNTEIPTMTAVAIGEPGDARFGSGRAIIRRGDNLWTIAKRVYGEGMRYTTIYQANTEQIRDPARIYPGQVFELPGEGGTGQ